jgi:hypothetical protein
MIDETNEVDNVNMSWLALGVQMGYHESHLPPLGVYFRILLEYLENNSFKFF